MKNGLNLMIPSDSKASFSTIMSIQSPKTSNNPVSPDESRYYQKRHSLADIDDKKFYSPSTEKMKSAREIRSSITNITPSTEKAIPFQNLSQISMNGLSSNKYSQMPSGVIDPTILDVNFIYLFAINI